MNKEFYTIIGLMSGTSLDGLDIALCEFDFLEDKWNYTITDAITIKYPKEWEIKLSNLSKQSAIDFVKTNVSYGHYLGEQVNNFIKERNLTIDAISSHGHTIFHQPLDHFTCQIGDGASIAAKTNTLTICDFRSLDIAYNGQGAPLVPIGDKLLFKDYEYCINLGGFANISYDEENNRIAYDICPVNIVLNHLANKLNKPFDYNGEFAKKGNIHQNLLEKLDNISFYNITKPKSLGKEWVENIIYPILSDYKISIEDLIATFTEHVANQIARILNKTKDKNVLITGGGAYNCHLIEQIRSKTNHKIILPSSKIIEFKEALIFAFLGLLRLENQINCLKSVTGATINNCGGAIYNPIGINYKNI